MSSKRSKLQVNVNGSKNTRLNINKELKADQLAHLSRYDAIIKQIKLESRRLGRPIDIVEIGAGELWTMEIFWRAYGDKKSDFIRSYTAYDIDENAIDAPIFKNMERHFDARYIFTDLTVESLSNEDESVDLYINTEVLEHIQPRFVPEWLAEANRVLRPGGRAYISTPNGDGSDPVLPKDHIKEWGFQELRDELEKYFVVDNVYGTFAKMRNIKKAVREQSAKEGRPNLSIEQLEHMENRFGQHWIRVAASTFYPEVSNNCNWILRKRVCGAS